MKSINTGIELFKENAKGIKIRQLSDLKSLDETLRHCLVVTGVKESNLPNEAQITVLYNFINSYLSSYTLEEVRTAFDLAILGRLNVKKENFQNFSVGFFSDVMKAYDVYIRSCGFLRESINEENKTLPLIDEKKEINKTLNEWFEKSKKEKRNVFREIGSDITYTMISSIAYDVFKNYCEKTKEEKTQIMINELDKIKLRNIKNKSEDFKTFLIEFENLKNGVKQETTSKLYLEAKNKTKSKLFTEIINKIIKIN
jgi:hypothetical protein